MSAETDVPDPTEMVCDRPGCETLLVEGDAPTEELLRGGVFCSPKCAMRENGEVEA